ncbi:hypothetical protein AMK68_03675, partial [candidate division KD3-62 bacterium DG_56]
AEWAAAKAVAAMHADDGGSEIAVLALAGGAKDAPGRAAIRLYGDDLGLRGHADRELEPGKIERDAGGHLAALQSPGGPAQIVTAINVRDQGHPGIELRTFGSDLRPRRFASRLLREARWASGLVTGELNGRPAIILASGALSRPLSDDVSSLHIFNANLAEQCRIEWQTLRQSSVGDVMVADLDGDGRPRIVTIGATVMRGTYGHAAQVFGEVRAWDPALRATDLFLWPLQPGARSRPSRACLFLSRRPRLFVASRSGASEEPASCEITSFRYRASTEDGQVFMSVARAWRCKRVPVFRRLLNAQDPTLRALGLEGLVTLMRAKSIPMIAPVLRDRECSLVRRTVDVLRSFRNRDAVEAARAGGFATPDDWIIIGPFDNAAGRGFNRVYPPERKFDPGAFYAGRDAIARWSKVRQEHPDIYVDLAVSALLPFARTGVEISWNSRRTATVAYALTDVICPRRRQAMIRLGRSDAARIRLNGREIWTNSEVRSPTVDDDLIPVTLRAGRNRIMLKVANTETQAWGFYFRITDRVGRPIRGLRYKPPQVAATQGDFLSRADLTRLLSDRGPALRVLAAAELARTGEPAGLAALERLAAGRHHGAAAHAALVLADLGERSAADRLAALAPGQAPTFRLEAANALRRLGDRRWKRFSLDRLRSKTGDPLGEFKVEARGERGFVLKATLQGEEMGDIRVSCGHRFHFGDGVTASCSRIDVFGMSASKFRRRGIGAEIIRRGCEMMAERGDACGTVATGTGLVAHRLYRRFGYVDRRLGCSLNLHELDLRQSPGAAATDKTFSIRRFRSGDRSALERLHTEWTQRTIGPEVDEDRGGQIRDFGPWYWVALRAGKPVGFVHIAEDPFEKHATVREVVTGPEVDQMAAAHALVQAFATHLRAKKFERLAWQDPAERLRSLARGLGFVPDPWHELHGWVDMFKIIRLAQLLSEIAPLFARRLARSPSAGWEGTLALNGSRLRATMAIADGQVRARAGVARNADVTIAMTDDDITRLVAGDCDIWDAYRHHRLSTRPTFNERIWRLVEALFPMMEVRQSRGEW